MICPLLLPRFISCKRTNDQVSKSANAQKRKIKRVCEEIILPRKIDRCGYNVVRMGADYSSVSSSFWVPVEITSLCNATLLLASL